MEVSTGTAEMPGAPSKQVSVDTQRRRRSSRRRQSGLAPRKSGPLVGSSCSTRNAQPTPGAAPAELDGCRSHACGLTSDRWTPEPAEGGQSPAMLTLFGPEQA